MPTTVDLPTGICVTRAGLRPMDSVGVQESPFTFRRSVQVFPGQRWELELEFLPQTRAEAAVLESFLLSLRGPSTLIRMGDPYRSLPLGNPLGTPVFDLASSTAGEAAIGSRGWTADAVDVLKANDLIQLGDQLFCVLSDVSADSSGDAVIPVWPSLRALAADGAPIITENARGVFAMTGQPSFSRDQVEIFSASTLQFTEVVQ